MKSSMVFFAAFFSSFLIHICIFSHAKLVCSTFPNVQMRIEVKEEYLISLSDRNTYSTVVNSQGVSFARRSAKGNWSCSCFSPSNPRKKKNIFGRRQLSLSLSMMRSFISWEVLRSWGKGGKPAIDRFPHFLLPSLVSRPSKVITLCVNTYVRTVEAGHKNIVGQR